MQKRPWVLVVAFVLAAGWVASAAHALPTGPIVSGNGQLEFSNFEFFSPGGKVDEEDITVNVLADGISLSGPVDVKHGAVNFFVTYDVRALGPGIVTASLELDADPVGLVLSTKRILGDKGDPCEWYDDYDGKGRWNGGKDEKFQWFSGKGGSKQDFDFDPFSRRQLAFLKTHQVNGKGTFLEAARFAPQESLHVIEHVVVAAKKGAAWNASINRFTVVPEPGTATLSLLGLGLLALRSARKR
jgi:hypothetical protein